jgi:ubiquinone/menaquinone biosynthesis C-methylase UbiE
MPDVPPGRGPIERFSNRVENYRRYRPGYPPEVLECLRQNCGLRPQSVIADIGSGTGLLSELFLRNGNRVHAVEPNQAMRAAAEEAMGSYANFISVAGAAEATTLPAASMDLVMAAQAFHWFDRERARREFERVLKPAGWLGLVWNERLTSSPFLAAYEEMVGRHSSEYKQVDHRNVTDEVVAEFYRPGSCAQAQFHNHQEFDFAGYRGRLLSSSYVPGEGQRGFAEFMREAERIFSEYARDGRVRIEYLTRLYYGRLR